MCPDPISAGIVISAALSAAGAVGDFVEGQSTTKTRRRQFDLARGRAEADAGFELTQLRTRQRQENEALLSDILTTEERARTATSRAEVAAAEGGAGGGASLGEALDEFAALELDYRTRGRRQGAAIDAAAAAQDKSFRLNVRNQLIGQFPTDPGPSLFSLGLGLASAGAKAFGSFRTAKDPETG